MRTTLAVTAFLLAAALNLAGASLSGVTLPDSVDVAGKKLVLNGMGLRSRLMFKVYVGGLYLEQKSADANAILQADTPRRMVLHFMRSVSKDQMVDAYREAFANNAPDAQKSLQKEIDSLMNAFEPVSEGDQMFFTYVPGTGMTLAIKGTDKVTIPGQAFGRAMFAAWLGPKPPSNDLKQGLLGK
ncbi:MAG: chalcone isomerase family protein [Vicinamibacterales bacterium]